MIHLNGVEKRLDQYIVTSKCESIKRETAVPDVTILKSGDDILPAQEVHVIETMEELNSILDEMTPVQLEEEEEEKEVKEEREEAAPVKLKYISTDSSTNNTSSRLRLTVPFSLDLLRQIKDSADSETLDDKDLKRFLARINPDDTAVAEAELSRQINQQDFAKVTSIFSSFIPLGIEVKF